MYAQMTGWTSRRGRTRFGNRGSVARVAAAVAALVLPGCDALSVSSEPEVARIKIDSPDVTEVNLITADWFTYVGDPSCPACEASVQLLRSDTSVVSLPFEGTYRFTPRLQFFAETFPVAREPALVSLTAYIDGREWLNSSRTLQPETDDGVRDTLRFVYQYTIPRLPT